MNLNFLQVLYILRAHYLAALLTLLVVVAVGIPIALLLPKQYTSTTTLVFDVRSPDPVAGISLSSGNTSYTATQVDVVNSARVAQRVVNVLRLGDSPEIQQRWAEATGRRGKLDVWLGQGLRNGLKVDTARQNNILNISYTATDPVFAALIANTFAQVYIQTTIELKTDPARQYARWFEDQGGQTRANLEKAQARLSSFLQEKGIVVKDEQVDAEMTKLNALFTQLTTVQAQTVELQSKQKSGEATLPDVMQNSVVPGLRTEIGKQESKLQEISLQLGKNHPQYQRMEVELAATKKQLEQEMRQVEKGFSSARSVGKNTEAELKSAIAVQRKKLLDLKSLRDQLAVLQRDVDTAQATYDTVNKRYNQTNLESQVTQANVAVLSPAEAPIVPSLPNLPKIIAAIVVGGILLGGGLAFLLELLDRRVRSIDDLTQMLPIPVLAVLHRPRKQSRKLLGWRKPALALR